MSNTLFGEDHKRGKLFVVSAPAGTGKSTLVSMLVEAFPDAIEESCSCTTREARKGEVPGEHYTFLSSEAFEKYVQEGAFLEHAVVFGSAYGTLQKDVERVLDEGKHVVLVIDTQGAMQIKEKVDATFIFITPPSLEELKRRLHKRQTEDLESIETRLKWAEKELLMIEHYDYHIVNDCLETSFEVLRSIVIAEAHKYLPKGER